MQRILGGSPGSVLVRLLFLSLLVGAFLAFLDLTPIELLRRAGSAVRALVGDGFEALRTVGLWILYGAMVVVPVWLLTRLFGIGR